MNSLLFLLRFPINLHPHWVSLQLCLQFNLHKCLLCLQSLQSTPMDQGNRGRSLLLNQLDPRGDSVANLILSHFPLVPGRDLLLAGSKECMLP